MPGCIKEPVNFNTRAQNWQTVRRARPQARPRIDNGQIGDCRRDFVRVLKNLANPTCCHVLRKTGFFAGGSSQQAAVTPRHEVTATTEKYVTRQMRFRFETNHLAAHWFDRRMRVLDES